jgi:hypothetical protein
MSAPRSWVEGVVESDGEVKRFQARGGFDNIVYLGFDLSGAFYEFGDGENALKGLNNAVPNPVTRLSFGVGRAGKAMINDHHSSPVVVHIYRRSGWYRR